MTPSLIAFCIAGSTANATVQDCHDADLYVLAPCAYEDGTDCFWNAKVAGNGRGDSFVIIGDNFYTWDGLSTDCALEEGSISTMCQASANLWNDVYGQ